MTELFGVPMTNIALGCVAVTALILGFIGWIALRNPVMFKTGLRNIPRRPLQTALIIVGLMLSTLIITAAFGTGDTMKHSIAQEAYTILGPLDVEIGWDQDNPAPEDEQNVPLSVVDDLRRQFADDPDVFAIVPYNVESMPILNQRTRLNEANPQITAFRSEDLEPLGGLKDIDGNSIVLADTEIGINEDLADEIDAEVGDTVLLFYNEQPVELTVAAILPNNVFGGTIDTLAREGAAVSWDFLAGLTGQADAADFVAFSIDGSERGGVERSDALAARLEAAIEGSPYEVVTIKQDILEAAELFANIFTTIFALFGMFSIAAGVLLIFLIFIMLAAERKPEMGMARAVGAKRRQIVESFLAEGMGYDIGSAVIGLVAGIGVAFLMVSFVSLRLGDDLGLNLEFDVGARSLVISFCVGIIVTFIVVFMASWRASRLNIVSAIRDIPESKPLNPEAAIWMGYARGALNGMVAFGALTIGLLGMLRFPDLFVIFAIIALCGVPGIWLSMVRNHNFGAPRHQRKEGERLPAWPWILGLVLLAAFGLGAVIWIGYGLAILIVRFTRDRRPRSMPRWLLVVGIVIAPLGLVLSALQDRGRPIAWSVGFGVAGALLGFIFIHWGLDANRMAWLAVGVSLLALWFVVTLRYFHIQERLVFTLTSAFLIVFWFLLPGDRLSFLFGELRADFEMFFVTGAVLVTCGTFLIVYNADIVLPAVARLGDGMGRIMPAVKTAIAYPLTSRFRTGLTIAMIGLIMFVLSLQSAMNSNFERAFAGDESRGGWNVRVLVNDNNVTSDFVGALESGGGGEPVDTSRIAAIGEIRVAGFNEVDIEDPEWANEPAADRDPADQYQTFNVLGVDQAFIAAQQLPLKHRAAGYATDDEVWAAVRNDPTLAVIPSLLTSEDPFAPSDMLKLPADYTDDGFEPFTLNLRNRTTGAITEVTVIGQTKDTADLFFLGIFAQQALVEAEFPDANGQQFYLALEDGTDAEEFAKSVESALVQAQADSLDKLISDAQAQNRTFLELFQGFLALGLIVGIAALGVVSLRAVVERRQQIGMLRAIGYSRRMVQLSFLMESAFIATSGILLGLVLGISFAANLFTSGEFGATTRGLSFTVPWGQIAVMTGIALVMAMLMTYLPARAASRVAIAEALRYE